MHRYLRVFGLVIAISFLAIPQVAMSERADPKQKRSGNAEAKVFGVPITPAVYLVNFMLLYIANPNEAAEMPAYRAPLPQELAGCLQSNPTGCPYGEYANSFDEKPKRKQRCNWPSECRLEKKWERLAPKLASHPWQINKPLGLKKANRMAKALSIDKSMILTDREYQCTIGLPPRDESREILFSCINNLTNSNGNTNIPLSSYGLAITNDPSAEVPVGYVQSCCAPDAVCLEFNDLFEGPLERISAACGWAEKFARLLTETPFLSFVEPGADCQEFAGSQDGGPCIVESVCN
jgi:hypothetical protein